MHIRKIKFLEDRKGLESFLEYVPAKFSSGSPILESILKDPSSIGLLAEKEGGIVALIAGVEIGKMPPLSGFELDPDHNATKNLYVVWEVREDKRDSFSNKRMFAEFEKNALSLGFAEWRMHVYAHNPFASEAINWGAYIIGIFEQGEPFYSGVQFTDKAYYLRRKFEGNGRIRPESVEVGYLANLLLQSRTPLLITGAGISGDSGIPSSSSLKSGCYTGIPVFKILQHTTFWANPDLVNGFLDTQLAFYEHAGPNGLHRTIAEMEQYFERFTVATFCVDNFHTEAGSANVIEIAGNATKRRKYPSIKGDYERMAVVLPGERYDLEVLNALGLAL